MQITTFAGVDIGSYEVGMKILNYHPSMACERLPMSVIGSIWEETPIRQAGSVQR